MAERSWSQDGSDLETFGGAILTKIRNKETLKEAEEIYLRRVLSLATGMRMAQDFVSLSWKQPDKE